MIHKITKKAGFVLAVAGAAVVGGAATAIVQAAIPSTADGQVHACYRNNASLTDAKGALRVIDNQAGQACTGQETGLGLSSDRRAYVNFTQDPDTGVVSVASSEGISTIQPSDNGTYCLKVDFAPKTAASSLGGTVNIRGLSPADDASMDPYCDSSYNAFIFGPSQTLKVVFFN